MVGFWVRSSEENSTKGRENKRENTSFFWVDFSSIVSNSYCLLGGYEVEGYEKHEFAKLQKESSFARNGSKTKSSYETQRWFLYKI